MVNPGMPSVKRQIVAPHTRGGWPSLTPTPTLLAMPVPRFRPLRLAASAFGLPLLAVAWLGCHQPVRTEVSPRPAGVEDWPGWRGPRGDGTSAERWRTPTSACSFASTAIRAASCGGGPWPRHLSNRSNRKTVSPLALQPPMATAFLSFSAMVPTCWSPLTISTENSSGSCIRATSPARTDSPVHP